MTLTQGALRRRLSRAFGALALMVTLLIPFTFWLTDELFEDAAMVDLLSQQLSSLIHSHARPFEADTARGGLAYYRPGLSASLAVPAELAALELGVHHGIRVGDTAVHVHVRELPDGSRAYLSYTIDFIERGKWAIFLFVISVSLLVAFAAMVFARHAVDMALRPLGELVAQIRGLNPEERGQSLWLSNNDSELVTIAEAVNAVMSEIDVMVERERAFASAASHELRTPLTVIQGNVSLLADNAAVGENIRRRLALAVEDMREKLDALLILSSPGAGAPRKVLSLRSWLPETADELLQASAARTEIIWDYRCTVELEAAPGAARVVFGNLLRNALKANPDGPITIRVEADGLRIIDQGPGIPIDDLPHVFEPRFRALDGGSGMGLYIAQCIASNEGWEITLANRGDSAPGGAIASWRYA